MSSTTTGAPAVEAIGKKSLLVLLGILTLAGLLRFRHIGADSLWHDEIWSIEMTVGKDGQQSLLPETGVLNSPPDLLTLDPSVPWWRIWSHMRLDNHPPLYTVLLRFWREMFGSSESAVRSLSAVVSLIAILAMFDAARHFHGVRPALWAALLMALATPQIQYAQETRSYALLLAEGMIAAAAIARLQQRGPNFIRAAVFALAVTAMALTHYFAVGAIAALAIYAIIYLPSRSRRTVLAALACAFALGLLLWAQQFMIQWRSFVPDSVSWLYDPSPHFLAVAFVRILLLPGRSLFDSTGIFQAASDYPGNRFSGSPVRPATESSCDVLVAMARWNNRPHCGRRFDPPLQTAWPDPLYAAGNAGGLHPARHHRTMDRPPQCIVAQLARPRRRFLLRRCHPQTSPSSVGLASPGRHDQRLAPPRRIDLPRRSMRRRPLVSRWPVHSTLLLPSSPAIAGGNDVRSAQGCTDARPADDPSRSTRHLGNRRRKRNRRCLASAAMEDRSTIYLRWHRYTGTSTSELKRDNVRFGCCWNMFVQRASFDRILAQTISNGRRLRA